MAIKQRTIKGDRSMFVGPVKDKVYYPTISISLKDLPEAKDWKVGELYQLEITVKQTSVNEDSAVFEIHKVGVDDDEAEDLEEGDDE